MRRKYSDDLRPRLKDAASFYTKKWQKNHKGKKKARKAARRQRRMYGRQ